MSFMVGSLRLPPALGTINLRVERTGWAKSEMYVTSNSFSSPELFTQLRLKVFFIYYAYLCIIFPFPLCFVSPFLLAFLFTFLNTKLALTM